LAVLIQMDRKTLLYEKLCVNWGFIFFYAKNARESKEHKGINPMEICVGTPKKDLAILSKYK